MNFNRIILLIVVLPILTGSLSYSSEIDTAETISNRFSFAIRYLGMKVTEVDLIDSQKDDGGTIEVKATSVSFGKLLFRVNNTYKIEYSGSYLPNQYDKMIRQKNFSQHKRNMFDRSGGRLLTWTDGEYEEFLDMELDNCRDFFSALLSLRVASTIENLTVYANNNLWNGQLTYLGNDVVDKKKTDKYRIQFSQITDNRTRRSDVLTNNIVKEVSFLYLWITDDEMRLPVKAEYDASPFSVFWTLEDYQISHSVKQSETSSNYDEYYERQ